MLDESAQSDNMKHCTEYDRQEYVSDVTEGKKIESAENAENMRCRRDLPVRLWVILPFQVMKL